MPKNIFLPGVYYQIHDVFKWDLERKRIRKTLKDRHIKIPHRLIDTQTFGDTVLYRNE